MRGNYQISFIIILYTLVSSALASPRDNNLVVTLEVKEYSNIKDVNMQGSKCEFWSFADHCDPKFKICLTNNIDDYNCNIFKKEISESRNKKYISNIYKGRKEINGHLSDLNPWYLRIDIKDDDHLQPDATIAIFHKEFNFKTTEIITQGYVNEHGVRITAKITITCNQFWHTKDCSQYCKNVPGKYYCKPTSHSVTKICLLQCYNHGRCEYNRIKEEFECKCPSNAFGERCEYMRIPTETREVPSTANIITSTGIISSKSKPSTTTRRRSSSRSSIVSSTTETTQQTMNKRVEEPPIIRPAMSKQNGQDGTQNSNSEISQKLVIIICGISSAFIILVTAVIVLLMKLTANSKKKTKENYTNSTIYYDSRFNNEVYGVTYPEENIYETVEKTDSGDYEELQHE